MFIKKLRKPRSTTIRARKLSQAEMDRLAGGNSGAGGTLH